jgi:hypothetical protein
MRDLTKSMLSLSWAMSLFGLKQMAGLFAPQGNAATSFEAVTRSAQDQLGPVARSAFQNGDNLQRGLVDLAFSLFSFGLWQRSGNRGGASPGGWGPCGPCDPGRRDWGRGDAGQPSGVSPHDVGEQGGWTPGDPGQQGGWGQAGLGQPGGWEPGGGGGGWQVGGAGGSGAGSPAWGGSGFTVAGAEAVRSGGDLTSQAMGWGIDLMQQGASAVAQTLEGAAVQQPMQGGDFQTSGGTDDRR